MLSTIILFAKFEEFNIQRVIKKLITKVNKKMKKKSSNKTKVT
jgi:hypothetical protein